jgi:hypothetical protein
MVAFGVASVKRELLLNDVIWMEEYLNEKGRQKKGTETNERLF